MRGRIVSPLEIFSRFATRSISSNIAHAALIASALMAQELTWQEYRSGGGYTVQLPGFQQSKANLLTTPSEHCQLMLRCNALPNQRSAGTVIRPGRFNGVAVEPHHSQSLWPTGTIRKRVGRGFEEGEVLPCNQQAGDCVVSLAFERFYRTNKAHGALAWLSDFRAGFCGAPYVWPLGTLDPLIWSVGFIEGRGSQGQP